MNRSWIPASAAALVTGAVVLMLAALLLPSGGDSTASTLLVVREQDGRWLAASVLFFLAAVALLLGLPSLLVLFRKRGRGVGLTAIAVMAMACAGTAGYGMLLVFFRALVLADGIRPGALDDVVDDRGLNVLLIVWIGSFYLGELLLAISVLRARSVHRWIPVALILHAVSFPVSRVLPDRLGTLTVALFVFGLCGLAISASSEAGQGAGVETRATRSPGSGSRGFTG